MGTEMQGSFDLSLDSGSGTLPGFTGNATGTGHLGGTAALSEIISTRNDRFGTDFSQADQLYFDQLEEAMVEDEELAAQAQANTIENFPFGFDKNFEGQIIDRREANEDLFRRVLADPEFSETVRNYLVERVYQRLRTDADAA